MKKHRAEWLAALLLGAITLAIHSHACANDFVNYDDDLYVTENEKVLGGLSRPNIAWAWTSTDAANWHPLTWMSLQLDSQFFAKTGSGKTRVIEARGFHLTNALLHTANTVLLFWVLWLMTGFPGRSWVVAALFALHPLHVESVAWVSERKDVLSTLFWMLTLLAYYYYARKPGWRRYLLVVLPFALGLTAKPMLVTLPFALLLLDYWPLGRLAGRERPLRIQAGTQYPVLRRQDPATGQPSASTQYSVLSTQNAPLPSRPLRLLLLEKGPLLILSALSCAITLHAQHHGKAVVSLDYLPLAARISNAVTAYAAYIGKMFYPVDLALIYPHPGNNLSGMQVALALAVLAAVSVLVVKCGPRFPYLPVGWLWYLGTLAPVIGFIQVGEQAMADRYTYIPLIGLFIMLAWGVADLAVWARMEKVAVPISATVLVFLGLASWFQIEIWRDSVILWSHTLDVTTNNIEAHIQLGDAYIKKADSFFQEKKRESGIEALQAAVLQFEAALRLDPQSPRAHGFLGVALAKMGMTDEAIRHFKRSLDLDYEKAEAHANLGFAYYEKKNYPKARFHFGEALRIDPNNQRASRGLAMIEGK